MTIEKFKEMIALNINEMVENVKTNKYTLSYLSWGNALTLAKSNFPDISIIVKEAEDGLPFFSRGDVHFVKTSIKVDKNSEWVDCWLPIMDGSHNAMKLYEYEKVTSVQYNKKTRIPAIDSRDVNDAIMRCVAKNIAMATGIGLSLYIKNKEDLLRYLDKDEPATKKSFTKPKPESKPKPAEEKKKLATENESLSAPAETPEEGEARITILEKIDTLTKYKKALIDNMEKQLGRPLRAFGLKHIEAFIPLIDLLIELEKNPKGDDMKAYFEAKTGKSIFELSADIAGKALAKITK